jgi:Protein of unknown function (DUF2934)
MRRQATEAEEMATNSGPLKSSAIVSAEPDPIAALAYLHWLARGCPDGSPEEDWFRAERELEGRTERSFHAA